MLVTKIEPVTRSKSRIYVDERRWCTLYNKELYRYSLREGQPVSDGVYGEIMGEVLTKRQGNILREEYRFDFRFFSPQAEN